MRCELFQTRLSILFKYHVSVFLLILTVSTYPLWATPEEGTGTPAAKAEFAKGEAAGKAGDFLTAANHYRKAIEMDPDYVEAHIHYVHISEYATLREKMKGWDDTHPDLKSKDEKVLANADEERATHEAEVRREVNSTLFSQYQAWAKGHPDKAVYSWALGKFSEQGNPRLAEQYYKEAIETNPKFMDAYESLYSLQEVMGELAAYRETLRKAVEAFPSDPNLLFYYSTAVENVDRDEYKRLSMEVVEKFPESQRAPQALYWLAFRASTTEEKVRILEMVRAKFPPAKFDWSASSMGLLFDNYDRFDRSKALALAEDMIKKDPDPELGKDMWAQRAKYARAMIQAEKLLDEGKPKDALATINTITLPRFVDGRSVELLRSRAADAAGDTAGAYGDLLKNFAKTPTDEIRHALDEYGKKLGKNHSAVESDIWSQRSANAHPATPFSLFNYTTRKPSSLTDFQGHVILLNFWYPTCGPCRGEFPYIKAVLDKYKDQGFQIVAVNVLPQEDEEVLPLLQGFGLDFVPLRSSDRWARDVYKIKGEPTNFLIGADGRMYFGPLTPIGPQEQRTLELQVEALLQQVKSTASVTH